MKSKKKEKDKTENNLVERISLKKGLKDVNIDKDTKDQIEERIRQIEKGIESEISDESIEEIVQTLRDLNGDHHSLGPNGRQKMWKLLKKKYPKNTPIIPVGKKDRYGNLITNHEGLKNLYLDTYIHRLRNRPIKDEFLELKHLKSELFDLRL